VPAQQSDPQEFYRRVLEVIGEVSVPYLIGGTHALTQQTGLPSDPRDFDVLLRRGDVPLAAEALTQAGYPVVLTHPHFVAKAYDGDRFVDLIFGSGNGVTDIDDEWFEHASWGDLFGMPVRFCAVEDLLWSKAFIMERERYDGADVAHMLLMSGRRLDWERLLARFGPHWRVLLSHLIMFGFVYPGERDIVPAWVLDDLLARLERERGDTPIETNVCQGTLVSRRQYLVDLRHLGMTDARLHPAGALTREEIDHWTAAAEAEARRKP